MKKIIAAESVSRGHPDKIADQISDAILDAYLTYDPKARVACETAVVPNGILLAGEISSSATIDVTAIAKNVLRTIGYTSDELGINSSNCFVENYISHQSKDIAQAIEKGGAGDQGIMIGYATDETESFMPLPTVIAHTLIKLLQNSQFPFLGLDAKTLVEITYEDDLPKSIHSIVLSTQHKETISLDDLRKEIHSLITKNLPKNLFTNETRFFINPAGRFCIGGPTSDTGMTGRKQMVDSYGTSARHGGGAFSGKDATKVDRSGAYLARYIAKNIVAARLAKRCEVAITYAIGLADPISLTVNTFNSSKVSSHIFERVIPKIFSLDVSGLIAMLKLESPIFEKTAFGGHFGRNDPDFTWERIDKTDALKEACL